MMKFEENKYSSLKSKESRKLKYKNKPPRSFWFGLGFIGLVGWSIVIPTLTGVLIGIWLDKKFQQKYSWTLTLLILGLLIGAINVWYWIIKEDQEIHKEQQNNNE